jgi:hypothetical protein
VTKRVLTQDQDEVRDLTDEETDQVSGGTLPFFAAVAKWIHERQTRTDQMSIPG